jgi:hypothetical protein
MTELRLVHRRGTLTNNTEGRMAEKQYARPVLKDLGRMDLVRAKSVGTEDGPTNNFKQKNQNP